MPIKVLVLYPDAIELHIPRVYDIQSVLFAEDSEIILGLWNEGEELVGVHIWVKKWYGKGC